MRILLHAWGSRGDVQPTLALAVGLREAGHEVAVAAARDFEDSITGAGVDFEAFDVDLGELSRTDLGRRWLGGTSESTIGELRLMRQVMARVAEPIADTLVATTDAYDAVVTTPILLEAMLSLSAARGRRLACALLQPSVATAQGASYVYALRRGHSQLNRLAGTAASAGIRPVLAPIGEATRRRAGLPPLSWRDYYRLTIRTPFLLASSPLVTPPAPDWPVRIDVTGYWRMRRDDGWEPDHALSDFLTSGPAPVYIGFGSMSAADSAATSRLVTEAVAIARVRAVVMRGTADLDVLAGGVHVVDEVPHERLFPLMAGVVGHGGAGTTAAALLAGVPQLVVHHMGDQPYWGRRVHELGVGPRPMSRRRLTADRLADGIRAMIAPDRSRAAADLGVRLEPEDGVARAVEALARLW